ncbi:MAG TPA: L-dopachrome tautomerase-related protein [Pseudomonadota bacterium]|nr:L-dopachrome tautomerase-related protein [Pseudomonadota bacterium]
MSYLARGALWLSLVLILFVVGFKARFGGGLQPFPDLRTPPIIPTPEADQRLEVVAALPVAPGNVAVSESGRVFFTFHPEGRPEGDKLVELVGGQPVAFPSAALQGIAGGGAALDTPLGVRIDGQERLWVIDHGFHGLRQPRLWAIDIKTRTVVHQVDLPRSVAGPGSFLQDLAVAADGQKVYIADASIVAGRPAIVVYDVASRVAVRRLERHESVLDQPYLVRARGKPMRLFGGLFNLHVAIDSIALDRRGEWLYFGAMASQGLYRVPVSALSDPSLSAAQLAGRVERFADKVQTDGISTDSEGNIYLTDIEHGGLAVVGPDRRLQTLFSSPRLRWADGLSFGPGGYLYIADSNLSELMMQSRGHMRGQAPYFLFRIKLPQTAPAGQ